MPSDPNNQQMNLERRVLVESLRKTQAEVEKLAAETQSLREELRRPWFLRPAYLTVIVAALSLLISGFNVWYTGKRTATVEDLKKVLNNQLRDDIGTLATLLLHEDANVGSAASIQLASVYPEEAMGHFEADLNQAFAQVQPGLIERLLHGLAFVAKQTQQANATRLVIDTLRRVDELPAADDRYRVEQRALLTLARLGTPEACNVVRMHFAQKIPLHNGKIEWPPVIGDVGGRSARRALSVLGAMAGLLRHPGDQDTARELRSLVDSVDAEGASHEARQLSVTARLLALDALGEHDADEFPEDLLSHAEPAVRLRSAEWYAARRVKSELPETFWSLLASRSYDLSQSRASPSQALPLVPGEVWYRPVHRLFEVYSQYGDLWQKAGAATRTQQRDGSLDVGSKRALLLAVTKDAERACALGGQYESFLKLICR